MSTTATTTAAPTLTKSQTSIPAEKDNTYIPRGPVSADLHFYTPPVDGSEPYNYVEPQPEGTPQRNFTDITHAVPITDLRGSESAFNLQTNAFATFRTGPSAEKSFTSDDSIKTNYYPEVEQSLLKHVPGASRVVIFDHTIRRANPSSPRAPVTRTHIDQTPSSAAARVHHHLPDEAEALLKSRVRIINLWRPLNGPVQSFPLAFADSATVPDEAVVPVQHRYPDRTGETAAIRYTGTEQKWYYLSGMEDEERLLLQCYDSRGEGARVPHSAFVDPRTPEGARARESIEVRALVFG